jgi:hypothetical protein
MASVTHRIAAGEDATQALLIVYHQHRAGVTLPHTPAGMQHRFVCGQHKRFLVFDNVPDLSVGHDPSVSAGLWVLKDRLFRTLFCLPHCGRM